MTAGERLQNARQSAGLTPEEVARQLNLRVSVITAIEQAGYDRIDSELFLKGYVRAYAALVKVDGDSIIRQLDRELEPARQAREAQAEASPLASIQKRKRMKKRIAKVVILLLIVVALVYGGTFYLTQVIKDEFGEGEGASPPPVETPAESPAPAPRSMVPEPRQEPGTPDLPAAAGQEPLLQQDTETGDTGAMVDESGLSEETEGRSDPATASEEPPIVEDPDLALSAVDTVVDPAGVTEPAEVPSAPEGLRVTFNDDCWVEVTDARGRTLVSSLRRAGDTLDVQGEAPLRVVFGAVSAVGSVYFNGEAVNLARYPARNNRVVFTLEP